MAGKPNDLAISGTLRFLEKYLPADSRILDAGCGAGELAGKLKEAGHRVIGLDLNEKSVEKTRVFGVEAIQGNFLELEEGPFDAICFSFSLHHIFPLADALEHTGRLLVPGGLVLAEEFSWDEIDETTARWFYEMWSLLEICGVLTEERGDDEHHHHSHRDAEDAEDAEDERPAPTTAREEWVEEHHHDPPLHRGKEMLEGVERSFDLVSSERVPTLFADFATALEPSQRGYDVALKLLELERGLIEDGAIVPLGLRIVAKNRA